MDPVFKLPSVVPQDLLIIQDFIGPVVDNNPKAAPVKASPPSDDTSIESSEDDTASEDEVDDLLAPGSPKPERVSDSSSDSDSDSDSDSADDPKSTRAQDKVPDMDEDDDEESGGPTSNAVVRTKNEVANDDINIPKISEVGPDEPLAKVGEIMSVVNNVVIIRGSASANQLRANEKALDSDTLLVFDDRKVMGYVYETFGPTYQPLYQVKYSESYPLDVERVTVGREIFHVPHRSKFVFMNELKRFKGSDASNVHDEEPAEYELEFSDDEEEAAHKARLKERRQASREPSVAASRHSTPTPSLVKQDDAFMADSLYGSNPYDAHGAYDMDAPPGPSRAAPVPYDDPYSEQYNAPPEIPAPSSPEIAGPSGPSHSYPPRESQGQGRGRGRGRGGKRSEGGASRGGRDLDGRGRRRENGRGRGRDRGRGGAGGRNQGGSWSESHHGPAQRSESDEYNPWTPHPVSPPPISPQSYGGVTPAVGDDAAAHNSGDAWSSYDPYQGNVDNGGYGQQFVQPHINPRFASSLGYNMGYMQQFSPMPQFNQYGGGGYWNGDNGGAGDQGWSGNWNYPNGSEQYDQSGQ